MKTKSKLVRILSIDGGGIRGIIPATILSYLENRLIELTGNPLARLADYFDMIAGTSTGGILACLYLCPDDNDNSRIRFSAKEALDLYLKRGQGIFKRSLWQQLRSAGGLIDEKHSAGELEEALGDYLGDTRLSQLLKPSLITSYDTERRSAFFFTGHNAEERRRDFYLRDVVRATSAAPTYFEAAGVKSISGIFYSLIDGGIFANNPSMCAFAEARKLSFAERYNKPAAENMIMCSLGTGRIEKQYMYDDIKNWGMLEWVKPVIDIMMSGVAETVDHQLSQIFSASDNEKNYLRISPSLREASPEMDDASELNIQSLSDAGDYAVNEYRSELDSLAVKLMEQA